MAGRGEIGRLDVGSVAAAGKVLVFLNPYVSPRVTRSMLRLYVEIYHCPQRFVIPIILVPISRSPAGANATKGKSEMGTQRSG